MEWTCRQSGDCCRATQTVQMAESELALLKAAQPDIEPVIVSRDVGRLEIAAGPCPYLADNQCSVYEVRPWRCRVWACFRRSASDPYRDDLLQIRLRESAGVRRTWGRMLDEAADWGRQHGWTDS